MQDNIIEPSDDVLGSERMTAADAYSNAPARLGWGAANLANGVEYPLTRLTQNYMLLLSLYRGSGILRRIIDKPVEDALAHWFKIDSQITPDQIDVLERAQRRTKIKKQIEQGMKWGELFGGAAGLMLIEGHGDILDQPLDLATVGPDSFKGIYVVDRWSGVYPSGDIVTDIGSSAFGEPEYYEMRVSEDATAEMRVHHSRILRFTGDELPYWEKQVEQHWGCSKIETVFEDLNQYNSIKANIEALLYKAQVWVESVKNLQSFLGTAPNMMQRNYWEVQKAQNELMSSMNTRYIDSESKLEDHQFSFAGLDKIFEMSMYAMSSVSGIPITILFGRSASGMDATGDADMDNYYTLLEGKQENKAKPVIEQVLPVLCMSEFGSVPDDINVVFNPVRIPSEKERAENGVAKTTAVVGAFTAGLVTRKQGLGELQGMSAATGMWGNVTDEDVEQADAVPEIGDMPGVGPPDAEVGETADEKPKALSRIREIMGDIAKWMRGDGEERL